MSALPGRGNGFRFLGRLLGGALGRSDPALSPEQAQVARIHLIILGATFLTLVYAFAVLGYVLLTPEIGVQCAFTTVVNQFHSEFLIPEDQEPLRPGDRIIQLGDRPVDSWPQLVRTVIELGRAAAPPVDPALLVGGPGTASLPSLGLLPDGQKIVRVVYIREGSPEKQATWCRLGQPPLDVLIPSILWFFLKIGLFVVGAVVYWKRPDDRPAAQFFLLCIVSLGAYIGGYNWGRILTQPMLLAVFMACSLLLPAVSLHFYMLFPRPKVLLQRYPRAVLLAIYTPALIFLVLLYSDYLRIRGLQQSVGTEGLTSELVGPLLQEMLYEIYFYFGLAGFLYLASVGCLIHSYWTAANATERNQVKVILLGAMAALVPIGYSLYLAYGDKDRFGAGAATWPMFAASVCVTLAFTVSITRYRLMQLDELVGSGMIYFLISSLAGLVYYGLVFTGMLLVGRRVTDGPSVGQLLAVSSTALLLLAMLDIARSRLKGVLDHHFRKEKGQLDHTLQCLRQAIEQLVDPPTLARRLLHTSADLLGVTSGAIYLRQGDAPLFLLTDSLGPPPPLSELSSGCPLVEALREQGSLRTRPRFPPTDPAQRQLQLLEGELAYALVHEGQLLGLLILGSRTRGSYLPEDLNLLSAFAQLTVVALVSAEGHRTIQNLNRELHTKVEKIAEQQRRILALQSQLSVIRRRGAPLGPASENGALAPESSPAPSDLPAAPAPIELASSSNSLVGSCPQVRQLSQLVRKVAASQSAVLLRGESGTGKEVLARMLHENSARARQPFIKVHCAALSAGLLESELFGHVKGAFTNAIRDKVGRFEAAHLGTLFLDEIGDISLEVQTKLLRVLQEMTFERVGSSEPVEVDVRIIAATHQDLEALMRQGRFREDLFYRLNVFPIQVPPLRERLEDVPELALHFLRLYSEKAGKKIQGIEDDALALLKAYSWPGNIRQLENVLERGVVVAEGDVITVDDLPAELLGTGPSMPEVEGSNGEEELAEDQDTWIDRVDGQPFEPSSSPGTRLMPAPRTDRERREREQLVRALAAAEGNKAEAARALGIARSTLVSKLKRLVGQTLNRFPAGRPAWRFPGRAGTRRAPGRSAARSSALPSRTSILPAPADRRGSKKPATGRDGGPAPVESGRPPHCPTGPHRGPAYSWRDGPRRS